MLHFVVPNSFPQIISLTFLDLLNNEDFVQLA
jgi:hypothetical protein